jgi:hypothetical protein
VKSIEIESIDQYIREILALQQLPFDFCIFRGQRVKAPLIPSIASTGSIWGDGNVVEVTRRRACPGMLFIRCTPIISNFQFVEP